MEYENLEQVKITDKIKVYNCDNMLLMKQTPDNYFDLAIVDPPYGIGMDNAAGKSKKTKKRDWDSKSPDKEYFLELIRVSKNQIIWGANHFIEKIPNSNSPCWISWDKREGFIPERTFADNELAYTSFKSPCRTFRFYWDGFLQKIPEKRIHPTQKPVALYRWILKKYAKPNDKILDTHLGSFSSALAAHDEGFEFTGCELDEEYFKSGCKRLQNHVNKLTLFNAEDF